ncbi:MAG: methyltransferase, partial [Gammaproteobacteria bacterium]|nr:methyltransferase [Gammaproteobacteria bacterium]
GTLPETLVVDEGGLRFTVPATGGQKTGWFFDQRPNRDRLTRYCAGRRVLDLFSYVGAWGLRAAAAGATEVLCVDSSAPALDRLESNAVANGLAGVTSVRGDAFEVLRALRDAGETFDTVVVDPPALVKKRKDHKAGSEAYRRLNRLALQLLAPGGTLLSSSCSFHFSRDDLRIAVERAARQIDVELQLLEQGHAGPDHPVHPAIPETDYLKCVVCRRLPD